MSRHLTNQPHYRNEFIETEFDFDNLSLDEQASFTQYWEDKREREKRKRKVELSRKRSKLRSDPGLLLDQELFVEEGNIDSAINKQIREQEELGLIVEDIDRERNMRSFVGNTHNKRRKKNQHTILAPNVRPISDVVREDRKVHFTFDTKQATLASKRFKFNLRSFFLNVKEINLESISIKGFNYGNYTDDLYFLMQIYGFKTNPISNQNFLADFDVLHGRFSFFLESKNRESLSRFNESGDDYGTVANSDAGGNLIYYKNFNEPLKLNFNTIERLTDFELQFYREDGSDMFTIHHNDINPRNLTDKISIVTNGNDAIDFSESSIERNARVIPGTYALAGNNVIEIAPLGAGNGILTLISGGTYTGTELATELQNKLNSNLDLTISPIFTVSFNISTNKFTISCSLFAFKILWNSGDQSSRNPTNTSIGALIGFDVTSDSSISTSHTSDTAVEDPNKLVVDQDIAAGVSYAMNHVEPRPVNVYRCYFSSFGSVTNVFTFDRRISGGIDYSILWNTGTNKNFRIARTLGWLTTAGSVTGNDDKDITASTATTIDIGEQDTVLCPAGSAFNAAAPSFGDYFLISSTTTGYYVWFNVTDGNPFDPFPSGHPDGRTEVQVDILSSDANTAVATKLETVIDALSDFSANTVSATVTILRSNNGPVTDADGATFTSEAGGTVTTTVQGTFGLSNSGSTGEVRADLIEPPIEPTPYTGSFNQNPQWRFVMTGNMILGPGEDTGL